jgi:hypothetical protein
MSKYDDVISRVFNDNFSVGARVIPITRDELAEACDELNLKKAVPPTKVWCNPALARLCTDLAHSPHG